MAEAENITAISSANDVSAKSGIGVLLMHGLTGMPAEMRPVGRHLERLGYKTVTPLLPGHGGTHHQLLSTKVEEFIEATSNAARDLAKECDQIFICGLSVGGLLAGLIAVEQKIDGMVIMSPTLYYDKSSSKIWKNDLVLKAMYVISSPKLIANNCYWTEKPPYGLRDPRLQRQITKQIEAAARGDSNEFGLFRTYWGSLRVQWVLKNMFMEKAHKINCPTLVIQSYEDTFTNIANATDVYKEIGSQDKSLVILTGCDHVLTLDLCKDLVASEIEKFITRCSKQPTLSIPAPRQAVHG